jgi:hypothetical protein
MLLSLAGFDGVGPFHSDDMAHNGQKKKAETHFGFQPLLQALRAFRYFAPKLIFAVTPK